MTRRAKSQLARARAKNRELRGEIEYLRNCLDQGRTDAAKLRDELTLARSHFASNFKTTLEFLSKGQTWNASALVERLAKQAAKLGWVEW